MHLQNFFTATHIRTVYGNLTVKTTRTQQCWVQNVRTVGCCDDNNAFVAVEAVHFYQQLVQCLFAFIMTAAHTSTTLTAHCIDFVDKNNPRCIFLGLFKQVSYTGCTYPNEHFYKVGTADAEECHTGFPCHSFCQQCFTGTRRPVQQYAFWNFRTDIVEFFR